MSSFYVITQYIIYDCLFYFNPRSREGSDALTLTALTCPKISIRALTRGATCICICKYSICRFQSALPRGERRYPRSMKGGSVIFQSALPRGERPASLTPRKRSKNFNPRSHEGSDSTVQSDAYLRNHFNPRSHEGSDIICFHRIRLMIISIRAPTRGATSISLTQICIRSYFNPRSHEGSDSVHIPCVIISTNFNPRSHEGSDFHDRSGSRYSGISIRAPTRGATGGSLKPLTCWLFQSALPRGERPELRNSPVHLRNFNPRSHEGSDITESSGS